MTQLSKHFTLAEAIKSQTAERMGIDNMPTHEIMDRMKATAEAILEPVRKHFGLPVTINSWYRSPALNRAIGGVDKPGKVSQHTTGHAVDFEVPGVPNAEVAAWVRDNLTYDQCIWEYGVPGEPSSGWVHVSYVWGACRGQCLTVNRTGTFEGLLA